MLECKILNISLNYEKIISHFINGKRISNKEKNKSFQPIKWKSYKLFNLRFKDIIDQQLLAHKMRLMSGKIIL